MSSSGTHEQFDRFAEARPPSGRAFGVALSVPLALIGCARLWHGGAPRVWALAAAAVLLICALVRPTLLEPFALGWMKAVRPLNFVLVRVVMGLLYFLVITPAGLARRMLVRDPLRLRKDPEAGSYWQDRRPPGPAPESMANQF